MITGVVGKDLNLEQGQAAARQVGLAILATLRNELGSLDRVKRLVKTLGMVNTAADFYDHPKVINGFSELMRDVFGDVLKGLRTMEEVRDTPLEPINVTPADKVASGLTSQL